jgi:hypothetical protein
MTTIEAVADVVGLEEAAKICGYVHRSWRFMKLVHNGIVPGAKIGREWRFIVADLKDFIRSQYPSNDEKPFRNNKSWQLAKRKTALTTIRDSRSAASECKNLLAQLRAGRQKNMKKSAAAI